MKKKYLILTIILFIITITIPLIYTFINSKKDLTTNTIEAKVILIGSNYLLVSTNNNVDYIIYTDDLNYNTGDTLSIEFKKLETNKSPYEATAKTITIINKTNQNKNNQQNDNQSNTEKEKPIETDKNTSQNNNNETNIIAYFETLDEELTNYNNDDETIGQKIKSKFVTCIDFIFYDKEIDGLTFKELTSKTKLKILEITLSIDSKIDSKFPNYKESISSTYQNIKNKIIEKYLEITTNICNEEKELCNEAKEGFKNLKDNFGITWNFIKELIGNSKSKLKDWYEIWRYQ